jgi:soluble lytic murein transglycosylase-like protein
MIARTTAIGLWLGCGLALAPAAALPGASAPRQPAVSASRVHLASGPAGRKVIFNEDVEQRSRRFARTLLPVPARLGSRSGSPIDLELLIGRHSGRQNLDPRLVRAVIQVESGYNVRARSNHGAMGLMQLMPETALDLAVADAYDPDQNLRGGTAYLRQMIDSFGRLDVALAAYNAGAATVARYGGIPPFAETLDYVEQVMALYGGAAPARSVTAAAERSRYAAGRPKPYVVRNSAGRIVVTTALGSARR